MLEVIDIHKSFGTKQVLNGVSFKLENNKLAGLIGPSGGGKSVLLKIIGHVSRPQHGHVLHYGERQREGELDDFSLMFQEGALFDSLSVFDNVAFPLVGGRVPSVNLPAPLKRSVTERVFEILARVGLSKAAHKHPGQISGGMRRRVSLARALVSRPKLMLLDDPTSGLDPVASSVIMDLIVELHQEYKPTTLIVSHDLRRLLPVVQQIFALFDGRIAFSGTLDELRSGCASCIREFVSCRFDMDQNACSFQHS